jgi:hypothetical protein
MFRASLIDLCRKLFHEWKNCVRRSWKSTITCLPKFGPWRLFKTVETSDENNGSVAAATAAIMSSKTLQISEAACLVCGADLRHVAQQLSHPSFCSNTCSPLRYLSPVDILYWILDGLTKEYAHQKLNGVVEASFARQLQLFCL